MPMKVNREWAAAGLLAVVQLIGKCKDNALEIAQIHGAIAYLKGVHMVRDFFLYQIGVLACVMFLVFGLILMEAAVIFYIPVGTSTRLILAFVLGGVHFLTGVIILGYFASSKRWLRQAAKYNAWIEASMEEADFLRQKKGEHHAAFSR